jgi:hypothetical protein
MLAALETIAAFSVLGWTLLRLFTAPEATKPEAR